MKLIPEQLKELTPEQQKAYHDGKAIAVRMHETRFSTRMYTVAAALLVVAMLFPLWAPVSTLMYVLMGVATLTWMTLFKLTADMTAKLLTQLEIEKGMTNFIKDAIQRTLEKQGLDAYDDDGTYSSSGGLNCTDEEEK